MKTLENVIHSDEVDKLIPRGPDFSRIWDDFVEHFDGKQIMWFSVVEGESYNFETLSPEIKDILRKLTDGWEHRNHFGVFLDW